MPLTARIDGNVSRLQQSYALTDNTPISQKPWLFAGLFIVCWCIRLQQPAKYFHLCELSLTPGICIAFYCFPALSYLLMSLNIFWLWKHMITLNLLQHAVMSCWIFTKTNTKHRVKLLGINAICHKFHNMHFAHNIWMCCSNHMICLAKHFWTGWLCCGIIQKSPCICYVHYICCSTDIASWLLDPTIYIVYTEFL